MEQQPTSKSPPKRFQSAAKSDNMSVSSQQMAKLNGLPGHKMLMYMNSPNFGQHTGESGVIVDLIQDFIARLDKENEGLQKENRKL